MSIEAENTLPDDAWKDSFDKLLDQRPVLREMNILKRNIRASFNMNSSYENSNYENSAISGVENGQSSDKDEDVPKMPLNVYYLDVPKTNVNKLRITSDIVSTPIRNNALSNPFHCTLSPIGSWEFLHFKSKDRKEKKKQKNDFNATPITENSVVNVQCIEVSNNSQVEKVNYRRCSIDSSPIALVRKKWKSKNQKQVCFVSDEDDGKTTHFSRQGIYDKDKQQKNSLGTELNLQPGKWRKSLNCFRRIYPGLENNVYRKSTIKEYYRGRCSGVSDSSKSIATISVGGNRKSVCIRSSTNQTRTGSRSTYSLGCNNFKRQVLQRCGQRRIQTFDAIYNEDYLKYCCKIGEGAFGEVFLHTDQNSKRTVFKIIPIEGKELVNGEVQKTFEQILPEIIISMELCSLNDDKRKTNITSGFVNLQRVKCVKGKYPSQLQKLWEEYDLNKESENDHPNCFSCNQQYVVLELGYSGQDLEGFQFKNAEQSFYALQQIILTLAVAENEFQFEHRDLHWGNVLVLNTNRQYISYNLGENTMTIPTKGVQITIIDYTLSRMTFNDYCFYNDLSNDEELFSATGDYQFEIYRMMRKILNNNWEKYEPKTNVYWISYIISKMIEGVCYKHVRSKIHLKYVDRMKKLQRTILTYNSCEDCARDLNLF
ncbi:haspin [Cochliomyia hominivorax]